MIDIEKNKQEFLAICNEHIKRKGIDKLLEYLTNNSDFFTAPASSKYHDSYEGGLCQHSLNVYKMLMASELLQPQVSQESIALCALFHDICKINFYKKDYKSFKDENGNWLTMPYYVIEDLLCMGHGEASVYILSSFIKLTREEVWAISWHMGGFDDRVKGGSKAINSVFERCPFALELHIADTRATYESKLLEGGEEKDGKNENIKTEQK